MRVANQKDFATGLLYAALGVVVAITSREYRMGTAASMGPGYFPFWLGVLLAVTGAVILLNAMRGDDAGEDGRLTRWDLRSLSIVIASVVLFGIVLTNLGLVAAVIVLIVMSSLASHEFSWTTTLINTLVLLGITFLVFVYGLSLQFQVWPPFLTN